MQRRAVHLDEGLVAPSRVAVQRLRDQFLAHAGFAADQHAGIRSGDLLDQPEDLLHLAALADEILEAWHDRLSIVGLDPRDQAPVLDAALDLQLQLFEVEGLQDVVVGSGLQRFHRRGDGPVSGHHQDDRPFVEHARVFDHVHTTALRHLVVRDHHVEHLFLQVPARLRGVGSSGNRPAAVFKGGDNALAQRLLVLDHQDLLHLPRTSPTGWAMGKRTENSAPSPKTLCTSIKPRWPSTILRTTASPIPEPCFLVVNNG